MPKVAMYQVDAFTDALFGGNPAAVCVLQEWLPDRLMQSIADENNLSETAFFMPIKQGLYHLRWFTPTTEVELCGHATLATAFVIFHCLGYGGDQVQFETLSGRLTVNKRGEWLALQFPAYTVNPVDHAGGRYQPARLPDVLGAPPLAVFADEHFQLARLETAQDVRSANPDPNALLAAGFGGLIITAVSDQKEFDFVSRVFAPQYGIPEDPVTGAAHCRLVPYWANELGRSEFVAQQASRRGGILHCRLRNGTTVELRGKAVLYSEGRATVPAA